MKKFSDLCAERFSVRSYQSTPVPEEALGYICECVRMAPSAVNRQPWKFIVVRTPELRKQLQTCYGREWFAEAPVYVVACRLAAEEWVRPADHKPHGDIDVAIAVEHLCLAATEQGLGTCLGVQLRRGALQGGARPARGRRTGGHRPHRLPRGQRHDCQEAEACRRNLGRALTSSVRKHFSPTPRVLP